MRLDTKEKRLQYRKGFLNEGNTIIDLPEIEFQAFTGDAENYYTLTAFRGTAGKPYMNYYYRTVERRDAALKEAIESQKKKLAYREQRKTENKGHLTRAAQTAAAIKERLKKEFPGVKFSVTSSNFSMGNSVDIDWTDGPISEEVSRITDQYEYGRFDGMQDLSYTVDIDEKKLGCPGAKYVHTNRRLSEEYRSKLKAVLEENFTPYHENGDYAPFQYVEAEKMLLGIGQEKEEQPAAEKEITVIETTQKPAAKGHALGCGCTVRTKAEIYSCRDCGKTLCNGHTYTYTDDTNHAINKNAPPLCFDCYQKRYNPAPVKSNVVSITDRIAKRRAMEQSENLIKRFKADYLPYLTKEDVNTLFNCTDSERGSEIVKICMRIDMEKKLTH